MPTDEVWDRLPVENDRDSEVRGQQEVIVQGDVRGQQEAVGQEDEWPSSWEQPVNKVSVCVCVKSGVYDGVCVKRRMYDGVCV